MARFLLLTGGVVLPGTPGATPSAASVLVRDDLIEGIYESRADAEAAAGSAVETVDTTGLTVLPGLIDCHVHLFFSGATDAMVNWSADIHGAAERARAHLHAGVTTVRDLGAPTREILELRDEIAAGRIAGPRVLTAGPIITIPDGHGHSINGGVVRRRAELIETIHRLAERGVDCIKLAVSGGVSTPGSDLHAVQFTESDLAAAVTAAHERGLHIAGHASNPEAIRRAAAAGFDSIEHGVMTDDAAIDALVDHGTTLVPTLAATNKTSEFLNNPRIPEFIREKSKITVPAHRTSIKRAVEAGVTMATGTDAGTTEVAHGLVPMEAQQLVECGLSAAEAITAATYHSAGLLGLADTVGTLEPGKVADVIAVAGDPRDDITRLADVRLVVKAGTVVVRR